MYATERWASPDRLRPRWRFVREGYWEAEAPAGLSVWEHPLCRPDEGDEADADGMALGLAGAEASVSGGVSAGPSGASGTSGVGLPNGMVLAGEGGEGEDVAALRSQREATRRLAEAYRQRLLEVRAAAMVIFPIAQMSVQCAGGSLSQPDCFTRALPLLPPLAGLSAEPPSPQPEAAASAPALAEQ
jgi:hypothetical protein